MKIPKKILKHYLNQKPTISKVQPPSITTFSTTTRQLYNTYAIIRSSSLIRMSFSCIWKWFSIFTFLYRVFDETGSPGPVVTLLSSMVTHIWCERCKILPIVGGFWLFGAYKRHLYMRDKTKGCVKYLEARRYLVEERLASIRFFVVPNRG